MAEATTELADVSESFDALSPEDKAWQRYGAACWDPLVTDEQRRELFDRALKEMEGE